MFCNVDGCEYSTISLGAFKTHVSGKHRVQAQNQANECDDSHDTHSVSDDGNATSTISEDVHMSEEDASIRKIYGQCIICIIS